MNVILSARRSLIVNTLLAIGAACVVALWRFESGSGLISEFDSFGYPFLFVILLGGLVACLVAPAHRGVIELCAYLGIAFYFVVALFCLVLTPSGNRVYPVANTLQWMAIIYVAAFVLLRRRMALAASATVFVLSVIPGVYALLDRPDDWDMTIGALFANAYVVHLMMLISLSLVGMLHDHIERTTELANSMENAALTDGLMGIANRRGIERVLDRLCGTGDRPVGLILLDIDNFKTVNDRFGHFVGDELLVSVARLIGSRLRDADVLGRWGGEELLVVACDLDLAATVQLAERIRTFVEQYEHPVAGSVTLSAGVALWRGDVPVEDSLRLADKALYLAKVNGRNRVETA
ncbi:hypothetical protein GCM10023144_03040 [Pigmentiphaga soli]|uniref:diguanylate cyclase n=1 Tax=Pigmentiphaga soli TaxID=1007095 RepID=A0ABP8GE99_9BURK